MRYLPWFVCSLRTQVLKQEGAVNYKFVQMQIQLMMIRLLQSSNTLQRFTAKRECWAIHFLIKLSSHSAIRIVGVDTISGSLSKFSQIPGVSFFQTITGTDPPKPRFIAHLGIGEKHQSYSLGFIFSNLARNTVDIS